MGAGSRPECGNTLRSAAIQPDTIIPLALRQKPEVQGALVSIETQTGDVVAMSGGYDFRESQFNRATQAHRQPGSSFKPVVYSAALDNGFTAASVVLDGPVVEFMDSGDVWRPGNYEKSFKGPMLLRTALALSRNLVTIRVAQEMGILKVIERARDLELEADFPEVLAVSLGAVALTPLNLTQAYTGFANGGQVSKARFILSVHDFWERPLRGPAGFARRHFRAERLHHGQHAQGCGQLRHREQGQGARAPRGREDRHEQ